MVCWYSLHLTMAAIYSTDPSLSTLARLTLAMPSHQPLKKSTDVEILTQEEVISMYGFLSFPREIRDLIYNLMFISEEPIYPTKDRAAVSPYINMLQTNHQIYSEILPVLYGKNTFQIRGNPAYKCPEFLNLLYSQRKQGPLRLLPHNAGPQLCQARQHLRRLNIPSHGISLDRLRHLFSLFKHFPNLEQVQVVYLGKRDLVDMDVINVCRLLRDSRPMLKDFTILKRINFSEAEDLSWTMHRPYYKWMPSSERPTSEHCWISPKLPDLEHKATVVSAPQKIPE